MEPVKFTTDQEGQIFIVRFLPNIEDINAPIKTIDVGSVRGDISPGKRYYSYALINGEYHVLRYGRYIYRYIGAAYFGGYFEDSNGRLLFTHHVMENNFEPKKLFETYPDANFIQLPIFNPHDLTHNWALEVTVKTRHGFVDYGCRWIQDDKYIIYDGNSENQKLVKDFLNDKIFTLDGVINHEIQSVNSTKGLSTDLALLTIARKQYQNKEKIQK